MKETRALHYFLSTIENESRFLKISSALVEHKIVDKIIVLGTWAIGLEQKEKIDAYREVQRCKTINNRLKSKIYFVHIFIIFFSLIEYRLHMIYMALKYQPKYINCHNVEILGTSVICAFLSRAKLIYMPHELETEKTGLKYKLFFKNLERLFIKYPHLIVVVSPMIRDWYSNTYKIDNIVSVRNIPINNYISKPLEKNQLLRKKFRCSESDIVFIYQGIINRFRGVQLLLDIFKQMPKNRHIIFMGYGDMVEIIQNWEREFSNIHYHPPVPMAQIIEYTSSADCGLLFTEETWSLSYQLTTANKIFEYIIAGVPSLISSNFVYLSSIVREQEVGWVIDPDRNQLLNLINFITREEIIRLKENSEKFSKQISWDEEVRFLINYLIM